jgi:hypothetical protein
MNLDRLLQTLAAAEESEGTMVTLTLDLSRSGELPPETRIFMKDRVLRKLRRNEWRPEVADAFRKIANRIDACVQREIRPETDGLFLVAGTRTWEVLELSLPMRNSMVVGRRPHLAPLLELAQNLPPALLVHADPEGVRMEELVLGRVRTLLRLEARASSQGAHRTLSIRQAVAPASGASLGSRGSSQADRHQQKTGAQAKELLQRAVDAVKAVRRKRGSDSPILFFGTKPAYAGFERLLPAELRASVRHAGTVPGGKPDAVMARVAGILEKDAQESRARRVSEFKERRAKGHRVALGPAEVFPSLVQGKVARIFLNPDDPLPGERCENCGSVFPGLRPACAYCGGVVSPVSLTQELVARRLGGDPAELTFIPGRSRWLEELGGLAALLSAKALEKRGRK